VELVERPLDAGVSEVVADVRPDLDAVDSLAAGATSTSATGSSSICSSHTSNADTRGSPPRPPTRSRHSSRRTTTIPRHIVLCSRGGTIEFASQESRRPLSRYLGAVDGRVPAPVLRREPLTFERDGRRLTVRSASCAGLVVLLPGEQDVRLELLTPRQRAILDRVARGETDAQIGEAPGIAAATVGKHLERIYARLDVHTRTAAAALLGG